MATVEYLCLACDWSSNNLPTADWRCPRCGDAVGAMAIETIEPTAGQPPEFVLSPSQQREGLPWEIWERKIQEVANGELTISPQLLAQSLGPFLPQPPAPVGRRRGPTHFPTRRPFVACLRKIIEHMQKYHYPMSHETIACTLRRLTEEHLPEDDIARIVRDENSQHKDAKAAMENLRRWCIHHKVNLDDLIRDVTS